MIAQHMVPGAFEPCERCFGGVEVAQGGLFGGGSVLVLEVAEFDDEIHLLRIHARNALGHLGDGFAVVSGAVRAARRRNAGR